LKVFERRPRLGPTASLCKGPASENLHKSRPPPDRYPLAVVDPSRPSRLSRVSSEKPIPSSLSTAGLV
jgi:hypothetical protein